MWAEARLRVKGAKFEAPRLGLCFLLLGGRRQIFRLHLVIIPRDGGAMRPPIFPPQTIGDTPQQYLHRARMFRDAAMQLPDYVNSEPNWPRYALLMHAIELALKAYARHFYPDGIPAGIEAVFLAFVIGALVSVLILLPLPYVLRFCGIRRAALGKGYTMTSEVPFGPFLIVALIPVWFALLFSISLPFFTLYA